MKYIFVSIILLNMLLHSKESITKENGVFSFIYKFYNYSLGPVDGDYSAKVYMKDNNIIKIVNLRTGKESQNILGIDKLLQVVNNRHNLSVVYDDSGFPKSIQPKINKNLSGAGYRIEIFDLNTSDDSKNSIYQERIKDYETNYQKWLSLNIQKYTFIYQDSRDKHLYMEGVEVSIDNCQVVNAYDVRKYQRLSSNIFSRLLSVDNLFTIVKHSLKNKDELEVLYEQNYGYPYLVILKKDNQIEYQIFSRNLKIGRSQ